MTSWRKRGFAEWTPRSKNRELLDSVIEIIASYNMPLTIRQIFYRLIGRYAYEKTERAYKNLGEMLNRARRARITLGSRRAADDRLAHWRLRPLGPGDERQPRRGPRRLAHDYGGEVTVVTVAITREQARVHNLPSAPRKATDNRPAHFTDTETWQAEALDPNDLAGYLEAAVLARFRLRHYAAVLREEDEIRNGPRARLIRRCAPAHARRPARPRRRPAWRGDRHRTEGGGKAAYPAATGICRFPGARSNCTGLTSPRSPPS